MSNITLGSNLGNGLGAYLRALIDRLNQLPHSFLALVARAALAKVFWSSAMVKLADWDAALALFSDEYKVPVLPPDIAAYLAVSVELSMPVLLIMGLMTRGAAFVLLGMTTVIQVFVYPQAWPTHIQWAAMLLFLLARGPGALSLDHWLWRRWMRSA